MKKTFLVIACVLSLSVNVYGVDKGSTSPSGNSKQNSPQPPGVSDTLSENHVPAGPGRRETSIPAEKLPTDLPANIPAGSITPDKIRAFLSKPREENYIILNFDNADLKDVINTVGTITNENFILSPGLDARVTIHSAKKIPVSEVLSIFESVLEVNGMALVRSGDFYKIVSGTTAKQKPLEVKKGRDAETVPDIDRPVTQIVPVEYVPATEISTVLTPMLSQFGSIIPNPRNNLLIINDLQSNLIRLLRVLKEIDVNAFKNTRMSFFKPRYSDVMSLSNELTEVLNALNLTREGLALIPIERINSLVVFSSSPTLLKTVEGWIRKLDEEVMTGQNIFVYPIQNVKAESIADILKTLYETDGATKVSRAKTVKKQATKRSKTRTVRRKTRSLQSAATSRVEIITFEPTNSLVILAPPGVYREIVKTIKKIDIYPREVLIEAVIAEVNLSKNDEYGIQWSVLHNLSVENRDYTGLAEGTYAKGPELLSAVPSMPMNTGGFAYALFRPDKLTALIRALASESKVNILSSPRLLVRDQEEASIEVGSDIPTATSTTSSTSTETLTQNIEYRTVGIKLKIKPTISEEKTVVLDIEQEVSSKGDNLTVGQEGNTFPSFSTTKTKTSIVVPDQQGIIIGGIMEESKDRSYQGIPMLSSIPIIGRLFRYDVEEIKKKELIILITPYVVANKSEADFFTQRYMKQLRELRDFLEERDAELDVSSVKDTNSPQTNEP